MVFSFVADLQYVEITFLNPQSEISNPKSCLNRVFVQTLIMPFSTIAFEMLASLVHKGPYGSLPSRLEA